MAGRIQLMGWCGVHIRFKCTKLDKNYVDVDPALGCWHHVEVDSSEMLAV
jgi:hypothetical protein